MGHYNKPLSPISLFYAKYCFNSSGRRFLFVIVHNTTLSVARFRFYYFSYRHLFFSKKLSFPFNANDIIFQLIMKPYETLPVSSLIVIPPVAALDLAYRYRIRIFSCTVRLLLSSSFWSFFSRSETIFQFLSLYLFPTWVARICSHSICSRAKLFKV